MRQTIRAHIDLPQICHVGNDDWQRPGRVGSISERGPVPLTALAAPPRDRAGDGDELIGRCRCGHERSWGAARHCLGVGAFSPALARRGQTRFEVAHRPCPAPQVAGRRGRFGGRTTPANPSRRCSRDSGQTANMVLLVVQIETGPPEQRVRRALQCADHRADAMTFDQPATRAGFPLAAGVPHEHVKLTRTTHGDQLAEAAELAGANVRGDHLPRHAALIRTLQRRTESAVPAGGSQSGPRQGAYSRSGRCPWNLGGWGWPAWPVPKPATPTGS